MKMTREERSWILYDCGNSAYSIAVSTALLPVVFGMFPQTSSMNLGYFSSLASILVAVLSPVLGTIADYKDKKKRFFIFFAVLGLLGTAALAFVSPSSGQWQLLMLFYVLSAVGFAGANVFYDAFLVDVTTNERMDKVSTSGFAYGYIFSVIPFALSLIFIYLLGMDQALGYQAGFLITALWWGLFTIPLLRQVKQKYYVPAEPRPVRSSFLRLAHTFKEIRQVKTAFIFLIAYFLYIDGVDTIIKMVVPYATSVLGSDGLDTFTLLGILMLIQVIAFPCAIAYGRLARRFGTRKMITVGIITYMLVCLAAFNISRTWHIFILGALVASAQGGLQALSRSYFARLIPKQNANEFFGFYNIFGKFAAIIGPALMALVTTLTGSAKLSIFAILPLFAAGLIVFVSLPETADKTGDEAQTR
ncbi:MAG: MFS transporter [Oscillospiraceae bacterium]|nr:MFS transporter [Oscillospiraceae bacterium]MDD4368772.1 MFS transporter [Oscillospiraceae bacterium]